MLEAHRNLRTADRTADELELQRRHSCRRPYLVDFRRPEIFQSHYPEWRYDPKVFWARSMRL